MQWDKPTSEEERPWCQEAPNSEKEEVLDIPAPGEAGDQAEARHQGQQEDQKEATHQTLQAAAAAGRRRARNRRRRKGGGEGDNR